MPLLAFVINWGTAAKQLFPPFCGHEEGSEACPSSALKVPQLLPPLPRTWSQNPLFHSMVTYCHRSHLNWFIIVRKEFIQVNIMNQHSLDWCAVCFDCSLFVLRFVSERSFHLSSKPLAQLFILWMGQHNAATLFPFWGSLGTTLYRRQFMGSRSHAPSGTPTNRSRGSCGWSTRTSAKVGTIHLNMSITFVSQWLKCFIYKANVQKWLENTPF